jgi:hypothetical protein
MTEMTKWFHSEKSITGDESFNLSGDELIFDKKSWDSLAREVIQNSLDARRDQDKPVHVKFENLKLKVEEIPGGRVLKDIIDRCLEEEQLNDNIKRRFKSGLAQFKKGVIKCIKITDSNTTGLIGCDRPGESSMNNYWYSLLYQKGKSDKSRRNSSGSQGIGKFAPFSFSRVGTVLYGTKINDLPNGEAFQGVARLTSFRDNGKYQDPKVMYSLETENGIMPIYEISEDIRKFMPDEIGTSLTIVAIREDSEDKESKIKAMFIQSVIGNYFIAIDRNKLTVEIMGLRIDSENLNKVINTWLEKEDLRRQQYYAYKFGKTESYLDKCTMYYDVSDDVNNKYINLLKNQGMIIEDVLCSKTYKNITGVMIIEDEGLCEQFKKLENVSHDKFLTSSESTDTDEIKAIIKKAKDMKEWIKEKAIELTSPLVRERTTIYGATDLTKVFNDDDDEIDSSRGVKYVFSQDKQKKLTVNPKRKKTQNPSRPIVRKGEVSLQHYPRIMSVNKKIIGEFTADEYAESEIKVYILTDDNKESSDIVIKKASINNKEYPIYKNMINDFVCYKSMLNRFELQVDLEEEYRVGIKVYKKGESNED